MERRDIIFRGNVQGVGFRYRTHAIASHFPITGYVQNQPDGSVRLVAEGRAQELNAFLAELETAMEIYIDGRTCTPHPATGEFQGFEIRR